MNSPFAIWLRLTIMMFLQFFIWGAWYVTAPSYLSQINFTPGDFGWTYSVGPIAGIITPLFLGIVADRWFATERVLGVMHFLGAGAMFGATIMMRQGADPTLINIAFFAHMLCYYPTLSLSSTLAMSNLSDTEKMFPLVRVGGTIGWIVAGTLLTFGPLLFGAERESWATSINMFYIASGAGLVLSVFCFTLPHTPPPGKDKPFSLTEAFGLNAIKLLARPSYCVFLVSSLLICIPLAFYYQMAARALQQTGASDVAVKMSFGQWSEIIFMIAMPLFFVRLGVKWMLVVGMATWVIRYALFAVGAPAQLESMILIGIVVHGICYDFFFVTGQIYTDKVAPTEMRGQAQGFLVLATLGIGMLVGAQVGGYVEGRYTSAESTALSKEVAKLSTQIEAMKDGDAKTALAVTRDAKALESIQRKDWGMIWAIPCVFAGIVMLLFVFAFRDDSDAYADSDNPPKVGENASAG
jgi:nucleoside transporter